MGTFETHFLDQFSPLTLLIVNVVGMVAFIELGYRIGRRPGANHAKAQHSQVRAIMGAALGLTAFLLAFTFATAQSHYEQRVQLMLEETRLANNIFLDAEFLPEPERTDARNMIKGYLDDRIAIADHGAAGRMDEAVRLIERAERLHLALWELALVKRDSGEQTVGSGDPFVQDVIGLMDLHNARIEASLVNRISYVIWITLYLTGALSMLIMGYQAGLVGRRSPVATVTLAVAFVTVMILITDLDRPVMSLFELNIDVMRKTVERMGEMLAR